MRTVVFLSLAVLLARASAWSLAETVKSQLFSDLSQRLTLANCQATINNNIYDLSALNGPTDDSGLVPGVSVWKFGLNPCGVINQPSQCKTNNGALCQYDYRNDEYYATLAVWDDTAVWAPLDENDPTAGVSVSFRNGVPAICNNTHPVEVLLQFPCQPGAEGNSFSVIPNMNGMCKYSINFPTPASCPTPVQWDGKHNLSGGSVFLIILFVFVSVYLLVGCLYTRLRLGAVGFESCPNADFWRDLPQLVTEGCRFFVVKVKALFNGSAAADPTYDNIK